MTSKKLTDEEVSNILRDNPSYIGYLLNLTDFETIPESPIKKIFENIVTGKSEEQIRTTILNIHYRSELEDAENTLDVVVKPRYLERAKKLISSTYEYNQQLSDEILKILFRFQSGYNNIISSAEKIRSIFRKDTYFFDRKALFEITGKKPFNEILNQGEISDEHWNLLKDGYEEISPETFIPFYLIGSVGGSIAWFDLEEENVLLGAKLENADPISMKQFVSLTKDFPKKTILSIEKIIDMIDAEQLEDKEYNRKINELSSFVYQLRESTAQQEPIINTDHEPRYELGKKTITPIDALGKLSKGSKLQLEFIKNKIFSDLNGIYLTYMLIGLRHLKNNFDSNMYKTIDLITNEIIENAGIHAAFLLEDYCKSFSNVKNTKKLYSYISAKIAKTKSLAKSPRELETFDFYKENIPPTTIDNACNILSRNERIEISELEECANIECHQEVTSILGKGVSGTTYKTFSGDLQIYRALKVFNVENETSLNEARLMAKLIPHSVENVVQVYDAGNHFVQVQGEKKYSILMEYIDGLTIEQILSRDKTMNPYQALCYGKDIMRGIRELRNAGIYHRDLHDRNIMIMNEKAVIIDLGAATENPAEIYSLNRAYGGNNDLVSLGQLMYKMVTGDNLFKEETGDSKQYKDQIKTEREKTYDNSELKQKMLGKVKIDVKHEKLAHIITTLLDDDIWTQPSLEQVKQTQRMMEML